MPCSKGNKEKYHNYVIIPKPVKQIESLQINLLSLTNILSLNLQPYCRIQSVVHIRVAHCRLGGGYFLLKQSQTSQVYGVISHCWEYQIKYWQTSSNASHWKLTEKLFHQCQCKRTQLRLHSVWILLVLIGDDSTRDDSVTYRLPMSCHMQQYIFTCSCLRFPLKNHEYYYLILLRAELCWFWGLQFFGKVVLFLGGTCSELVFCLNVS